MTGLWLSLLLLGPRAAGAEAPRVLLVPTATSERGDVGDVGLANALAQALVDAGLAASRSRDPTTPCRDGCVRVFVRRTAPDWFAIEVRGSARADAAHALLRLDSSASAFDQAHALAIEVEMLAGGARARRRRPARLALALPGAMAGSAPTPDDRQPARANEVPTLAETGEPTPAPPAAASPARAPATPGGAATVAAVPASAPPAPTAIDARLSLNVAALVLAAPGGDLLMRGSTLGVRLRVHRRVDVRTAISLLRPERRSRQGVVFQRELLPLQLAAAVELPRVPSLRAGAGIEAILMSGEEAGREGPAGWSMGAMGRIEYRYAIRSFALISSLQAALHPAAWRTLRDTAGQPPDMPRWTLGAALGLEFTVF